MRADVCLLSPLGRAPEPMLPLALMCLAAWLERQGDRVAIVDVKSDPYSRLTEGKRKKLEEKALRRVETLNPMVVGITCLTPEVLEVRALAREIKARLPETRVIAGGVHPTLFPQDLLYPGSPVDWVALGEGEETLGELVGTLKQGMDWRKVPGLAWLEEGSVARSSHRPLLDLNRLPIPSYHLVDMEFYTAPTIYTIRHMLISAIHIFTTRGCPEQCTFCVNKNLWRATGSPVTIRYRDPTLVVDELEFLAQEYDLDGFYIYDDTFTVSKKHVARFCDELSDRGLGLIWGAETRVNLVDAEMLQAMRKAGCVQIDFGVETGSQEILDRMKKGITVEQVREAFRLCHQIGLRTYAAFMFNTPGEKEEDVQKTLRLAKEINADGYNFGLVTPYPGTDLYQSVQPPLKVEEYPLYLGARQNLQDPRFKFAEHDLDLHQVAASTHTLLNSLRKRSRFFLHRGYWKRLLKSRKKAQYLLALVRLARVTVRYSLRYLRFAVSQPRG